MEIWKAITGYEGRYEVSTLGRVRSLDRYRKVNKEGNLCLLKGQQITLYVNQVGYPQVTLSIDHKGKKFTVHTLVANTFLEKLPHHECVNHINGIKTDNRVENLEWSTYGANNKHAYDTKLKIPYSRFGEKNPRCKYSSRDIKKLRVLLMAKSVPVISRVFGVPKGTLYNIKKSDTRPLG
jgi:hypothetical protein